MNDNHQRINLIVTGKVQGVFYRASTLEMAQRLSLMGWVRNLPEGAVEIVAEGSAHALEELMRWCRHGPPEAKVDDVAARWDQATLEFRTFRVID